MNMSNLTKILILYGIIIIIIVFCVYILIKGFNVFWRNLRKSIKEEMTPKASISIYNGQSELALKDHPEIHLEEQNTLTNLDEIPVWVSQSRENQFPKIYEDLLWKYKANGEYVYFLAGDYEKNSKGMLLYPTSETSCHVELNFEEEVIRFSRKDLMLETEIGNDNAIAHNEQLLLLSINQVVSKVSKGKEGLYVIFLNPYISDLFQGEAHAILSVKGSNLELKMVYREYREPVAKIEIERLLQIIVKTKNSNLLFSDLLEQFIGLIKQYNNMPYLNVRGSTRYNKEIEYWKYSVLPTYITEAKHIL